MKKIELLSPAKNLEQGREAINHGADAVYVGPPAYGARAMAGNSLDDIEKLVSYAHSYRAKVYATVNTLLYDDELEGAVRLIHQLHGIGVDAILIQDMGLLECDLPPIELHASTQTHNATPERVKFLQQAGLSRVVLARETSLHEMREIRRQTSVELEAFVQGALCVCYSGQCYLSEYLTRRSGNRGCCTQPCRSAYDLLNGDGRVLQKNRHLLSLKDFSAAQHVESMADAGIVSFKIEGRLKDMSYVKNVTAFYRQLLDNMMSGRHDYAAASAGKSEFYFMPDLEKTFNRGFTDYFLRHRQPMASMATQKSVGKCVGRVSAIAGGQIAIDSAERFAAGDGLCFLDGKGELQGFMVNHAEGKRIVPNKMPAIKEGDTLYRNNDYAFEKLLQGKTAERKMAVNVVFSETADGFGLQLTDEAGAGASACIVCAKEAARNREQSEAAIRRQLGKMGDTPYRVDDYADNTEGAYFLSASLLNDLRRRAVDALMAKTLALTRPQPYVRRDSGEGRVADTIDYRFNVVNKKAAQFYSNHGATTIEPGLEVSRQFEGRALMTTRYCLRYELGQCLKLKNNKQVDADYRGELYLKNNHNRFRLLFDCGQCQMRIVKDGE